MILVRIVAGSEIVLLVERKEGHNGVVNNAKMQSDEEGWR
jgi:hypothetical protein